MLALISDLHFCDGTATDRNVQPDAFQLALDDIYELAAQHACASVELVFLGDVFDLLRTERWFAVPPAERPWGPADALDGGTTPAVLGHAHDILGQILEQNAEALATLRAPRSGLSVRRTYLTGNHDRLALLDPTLMERFLGALDAREPRPERHAVLRPEYGLLARHGHEWDEWNFERFDAARRSAAYDDADYLATPIGDPITTELVARLPYELKRELAGAPELTADEKASVYRHMQRIEDVRPMLAALQWPYFQAKQIDGTLGAAKAAVVRRALDAAVMTVSREFRALPFYEAWDRRHSRLFHFGAAARLASVLEALSTISLDAVGSVAAIFEKVIDGDGSADANRKGAALEDLAPAGAQGTRFVVYGHTHEPVQAALHAGPSTRDLYLNTGTFRQRVFRTDDRKSFIGWEHLTYVCFLASGEVKSGQVPTEPRFSAWTGTRGVWTPPSV